MLSTRPGTLSGRPWLLTCFLLATALYTLAWSFRLPAFARRAERQPLVLLADLCLSMAAVWVTGGWASPFFPFVFGALILPGALFHWRGALVAVVAFLLVDQIAGWTSWQTGTPVPLASPMGLLSYVWPALVAAFWPLSLEFWRWRLRRSSRKGLEIALPARSPAPLAGARRHPASTLTSARARETDLSASTWNVARPRSQTLERPPAIALQAAIRQTVAEAEERGLRVQFVADGAEPLLPLDHIHLLAKAVEIGLDNVQRHTETREAEVTVAADSGSVLLTVRDHGGGLLDGTAEPPGFHQLRRLRYRLEEIEGSLDVREADGGGVLVSVRVPFPKYDRPYQ